MTPYPYGGHGDTEPFGDLSRADWLRLAERFGPRQGGLTDRHHRPRYGTVGHESPERTELLRYGPTQVRY
jgi:hypothetical protein